MKAALLAAAALALLLIWAHIVAAPGAQATESAASGTECQLDRAGFELLVGARMVNYASTGDSWSPRAQRWVDEISKNASAGDMTTSLNGAFGRFRRYCEGGDDFMAGLTLGEWIGIALRAP